MNKLDRLLLKAREFTSTLFSCLFTPNEDDFIQALGVNPKDYEVAVNGVAMYDTMKALNDTCERVWEDCNHVGKRGDIE